MIPVLAGLVAAGCQGTPNTPADKIFVGGDIVTVNDVQPTAEAVAVRGGKILAVGGRAEVEDAHEGAATEVATSGVGP